MAPGVSMDYWRELTERCGNHSQIPFFGHLLALSSFIALIIGKVG